MPYTGGFGSCRCPGTDALFAAPWTGGVRREMKQLGESTSVLFREGHSNGQGFGKNNAGLYKLYINKRD